MAWVKKDMSSMALIVSCVTSGVFNRFILYSPLRKYLVVGAAGGLSFLVFL